MCVTLDSDIIVKQANNSWVNVKHTEATAAIISRMCNLPPSCDELSVNTYKSNHIFPKTQFLVHNPHVILRMMNRFFLLTSFTNKICDGYNHLSTVKY